ncbi:MAG: CehA/McbA family metallohydrolase [Methanomassiliicoccales archaeon]|nr:CehA/McbA family metallohydrolase [Methanomassiliicoccales archaeon]
MRFDLHVHSSHSGDSTNAVEELLDACVRKGLAGVAIMDHNSLEGSRYAISLHREDIVIVPGMEISSAQGHILAYNVQEEVPRDLEVADTIDLIRAQGGIAVAAHPYRMWSGLGEEITLANDFDAIEVHNGRSTLWNNQKAVELAIRMCLPFTAGSDSHEPTTIGSAYFETKNECHSVEEVIREVLAGSGSTGGRHRPKIDSVRYGVKCVRQWLGRGLKRM